MRTDLRNTLDPELDLYDTAFMSYSLHLMYQSVEDLRNTLDPELDLYDTAFMSYSLH